MLRLANVHLVRTEIILKSFSSLLAADFLLKVFFKLSALLLL